MSEDYDIVQISGEPRSAGSVGVRVRVRISGCPSSRWSRSLAAHLTNELVGHKAIGHLQLNDLVQGDQIVLEGVEDGEAAALATALRRAVDATNGSCGDQQSSSANVPQAKADALAREMTRGTDSGHDHRSPR